MNIEMLPINFTSYQLKFGENKFYPISNGKVLDLLCNIIKQNGMYFFRIEEVPSKEYFRNNTIPFYLKTKNIADIQSILNRFAKESFVEYSEEVEKVKIPMPGKGLLIDLEGTFRNKLNEYKLEKDLNEQIIMALDLFEIFEELYNGEINKMLSSPFEKDMLNAIELFITQFDTKIFTKVKINKTSLTYRMISFYNKNQKNENESTIIEILSNIVDYLNKLSSKDLESLFVITTRLLELATKENDKKTISKYTPIQEKIEEQYSKQNEKRENSVVNIEREYKKILQKNGFSIFDQPENFGNPYTDEEMEEIISTLSDILPNEPGEYSLSMKNAKDVIAQLAFDMKRSLGGIIEIYQFCFSSNPFRSLENQYINDDKSYTMKRLIIRNKLGLDKYGKSNQWFKDIFEQKMKSGYGSVKNLQENIDILNAMK